MQEVDRLGWAATAAFQIGPWVIGVRSNTRELDALLRAGLRHHLVDDVDAPPNYSIVVDTEHQRGPRRLNTLYWEYSTLMQTRFPDRVVRALLAYLGDHADQRHTPVRVPSVTFVGPGGAVGADPSLANVRHRLTPRLRRLGVHVVDSRWADIDDTGELVVQPPPLRIDEDALEAVLSPASQRTRKGPDLPAPAGRYRLRGWLMRMPFSTPDPSEGRTVSLLASKATGVSRVGGQRTLDALARSVEGATIRTFWPSDLDAVESMLRELCA